MPRDKVMAGRLMALLAAILFGAESVVVQLCYADGFTVIGLIAVRYSMAALFFGATLFFTHSPLIVEKPYRRRVFFIGLLFIASNWLLFISLAYLSAPLAILFFYAYPSLTALVAKVVYHTRLGWVKVLALVISMVGIILLYWSSAEDISFFGAAMALAAALLNAIKLNMSADVLPQLNVNTFSFAMSAMMSIISVPVCLIFGQLSPGIPGLAWFYAFALALFVSYGSMLLINSALRYCSAVDVSIICLMEPPFTALTAFLVFGDKLAGWQIVGALLVMLSVAWPEFLQYAGGRKRKEKFE